MQVLGGHRQGVDAAGRLPARTLPLVDRAFALVDPVLAVVFPSRCPACQSLVERPSRGPLCESCWNGLSRHRQALCRCGVPLVPAAAGVCGRCRRGLNPVTEGASLGPYQGALRVVLHEIKYRGRRRAASRLAELALACPDVRRLLSPGVVVVPVPLHPRRRRERGFNQSELLAADLARRTGTGLLTSGLVRRKDTASQTGLSAAARRANVAGAFVVRCRPRIAGQVVVLVDDVLTTGATTRACADALRDAGAAAVRVLTLARVS